MNIAIIIIVSISFALTIASFILIFKMYQKQSSELKQPVQGKYQQLFSIKMQAYERIILYVERIDLEGLIMRAFLPDMTAQQLQTALLRTIREEFEHNITQQLYVSDTAWYCVTNARKQALSLIAQAYGTLASSDNGMELAQLLFAQTQDTEQYNFPLFTSEIRKEMRKDLALL
jgi:hypothetical protein